jgi:hypothetical protein
VAQLRLWVGVGSRNRVGIRLRSLFLVQPALLVHASARGSRWRRSSQTRLGCLFCFRFVVFRAWCLVRMTPVGLTVALPSFARGAVVSSIQSRRTEAHLKGRLSAGRQLEHHGPSRPPEPKSRTFETSKDHARATARRGLDFGRSRPRWRKVGALEASNAHENEFGHPQLTFVPTPCQICWRSSIWISGRSQTSRPA